MGLASKLAAANANAGGAAGAPPAASGAPSYQSAPQSSYPGQAPQGQQAYGAPQGQPSSGQSSYPGQYGAPGGQPPNVPSRPGQQGPPSYGQPPQSAGQPYGQQPGQYGQAPQQYGQQPQGSSYPGQQQPYGQAPQSGQPGSYNAPPGAPPGGRPTFQYGAPAGQPGQQQYGAPPQQQYGGAPQPQQQQNQAPAGGPGQSGDSRFVLQVLQQGVQDQNIQAFYPPGSLEPIAQRVAASGALARLAAEWKLPMEVASDLCKLALFDIVLYIDDSGSMSFEEGGERIDDMKLILNRVAHGASLFDQDGIQVRFMNSQVDGEGIRTVQEAEQLVSRVRFSGLTPLGTSMDRKIIQPLVLGPARANRLQKPVLIITITDGQPAGESRDTIVRVITNANRELSRTRYGSDALSFQFAQVGSDMKAQQFLEELDNNPEIGGLIDCTSNFDKLCFPSSRCLHYADVDIVSFLQVESAEMLRKSQIELTPDLWIVKMMLGGIDSSYDEKDEKR